LLSSAVEKPAYCLIVHGLPRYIVAYGPLRKGGNPETYPVSGVGL
jgi:hypothetical protein